MASPIGSFASRQWSCDSLLRGCSFLAEQQQKQQHMSGQDVLQAPWGYVGVGYVGFDDRK